MAHGSDIAFTDAVKAVQEQYGVRAFNEQVIAHRPWGTEVTPELAKFIALRDSFYLGTPAETSALHSASRRCHGDSSRLLIRRRWRSRITPATSSSFQRAICPENDRSFIFLIDYETRQRIKIWGRARFVEDDADLLAQVQGAAGGHDQVHRAVLFKIETWDVNCPQNIPQRFSEETVAQVVKKLTQRVADLEAQLAAKSD